MLHVHRVAYRLHPFRTPHGRRNFAVGHKRVGCSLNIWMYDLYIEKMIHLIPAKRGPVRIPYVELLQLQSRLLSKASYEIYQRNELGSDF